MGHFVQSSREPSGSKACPLSTLLFTHIILAASTSSWRKTMTSMAIVMHPDLKIHFQEWQKCFKWQKWHLTCGAAIASVRLCPLSKAFHHGLAQSSIHYLYYGSNAVPCSSDVYKRKFPDTTQSFPSFSATLPFTIVPT